MTVPNVPNWLTADFLKACFESEGKHFQNIDITNHTIEPAVAPGNNYGSHMFRVKLAYTRPGEEANKHVISLIVKAPLTDAPVKGFSDFLEEATKKEPRFYNEFISETYKLCKHDIVPKHYVCPQPMCLVLEDLCASGYVMADRHKLLDFDQCQLYVKASAKLHALSIAVHKTHPEMVESLVEDPMKNEKFQEATKYMLSNIFQCTTAYLEDKPDCKEYLEFFKHANESLAFGMAVKEIMNSNAPLKALVQADPWCTNMMFKYNSTGDAVSIKLFDFQGLKFTSPVENLLTFVWASANPEVRRRKIHDLYHLYCDSLNRSLVKFGCSERLLFDQLMTEIRFRYPWLLLVVCMLMPITLSDEAVNMADFFNNSVSDIPAKERPIYKIYQSSSLNKYFPETLHQLGKEGVFDSIKEKLKQINAVNL